MKLSHSLNDRFILYWRVSDVIKSEPELQTNGHKDKKIKNPKKTLQKKYEVIINKMDKKMSQK